MHYHNVYYYFLLVLVFNETSLWPELSIPPRVIIQGDYCERHRQSKRRRRSRTTVLVFKIEFFGLQLIYSIRREASWVKIGVLLARSQSYKLWEARLITCMKPSCHPSAWPPWPGSPGLPPLSSLEVRILLSLITNSCCQLFLIWKLY